jgi:hypothetical protein
MITILLIPLASVSAADAATHDKWMKWVGSGCEKRAVPVDYEFDLREFNLPSVPPVSTAIYSRREERAPDSYRCNLEDFMQSRTDTLRGYDLF